MGDVNVLTIDLQPLEEGCLPVVLRNAGVTKLPRQYVSSFVTSADDHVHPRLLDTLEEMEPGQKARFYLPFGDGFQIRLSFEGAGQVKIFDHGNVLPFPGRK